MAPLQSIAMPPGAPRHPERDTEIGGAGPYRGVDRSPILDFKRIVQVETPVAARCYATLIRLEKNRHGRRRASPHLGSHHVVALDASKGKAHLDVERAPPRAEFVGASV
jgi:hypothetical protein